MKDAQGRRETRKPVIPLASPSRDERHVRWPAGIGPTSLRSGLARNGILAVAGCVGIAASLAAAPGIQGMLGAGLALVMMAIAVNDARYFIIPDPLTAAALALGMIHAVALDDAGAAALAWAMLRGGVLALIFWAMRVLYRRFRGRDGIGLGDVKLAAVAGVWLDWMTIPLAVEVAAVAALIFYLVRHVRARRAFRATARLPFGLFFAPAIWLGWLGEALLGLGLGGLFPAI
jgi:leader peptidase (prepilin peptidase)/N-methyltransferase